MMYTMPKNLLSICVNFTLATQQKGLLKKMKLGSNEQSCRNGFLAEISSGDRPLLSVFHEIRGH